MSHRCTCTTWSRESPSSSAVRQWASRKWSQPATGDLSGRRDDCVSVAGVESCLRGQVPRGESRREPSMGRVRVLAVTRRTIRVSHDEEEWMENSRAPSLDDTGRVLAFGSRHPIDGRRTGLTRRSTCTWTECGRLSIMLTERHYRKRDRGDDSPRFGCETAARRKAGVSWRLVSSPDYPAGLMSALSDPVYRGGQTSQATCSSRRSRANVKTLLQPLARDPVLAVATTR